MKSCAVETYFGVISRPPRIAKARPSTAMSTISQRRAQSVPMIQTGSASRASWAGRAEAGRSGLSCASLAAGPVVNMTLRFTVPHHATPRR